MSRYSIVFIFVIFFISYSTVLPQQTTHDPEINLKAGTQLFDNRGFLDNSNNNVEEHEIINEYSGNVMLKWEANSYKKDGEKTTETLIYNSNVEHMAFFNEGEIEFKENRSYSLNAPEWIIGINGFAIQTLNFETHVYTHANTNEAPLTGENLPLLIPGYHFSERIASWAESANGRNFYDHIQILLADGSVMTLCNIGRQYDVTDRNSLVGIYMQPGEDNKGYAIVEWMDQSTKDLRQMWYKPGDGNTYYFAEHRNKFCTGPSYIELKAMYLEAIIGSTGMRMPVGYNNYITSGYGRMNADMYLDYNANNDRVIGVKISGADRIYKGIIEKSNEGSALNQPYRVSSSPSDSRIKYLNYIKDNTKDSTEIRYTNKLRHYSNASSSAFDLTHVRRQVSEINYPGSKSTAFTYYDHLLLGSEGVFDVKDINYSTFDDYDRSRTFRTGFSTVTLKSRQSNSPQPWTEDYRYTLDYRLDNVFTGNVISGIHTIITKSASSSNTHSPVSLERDIFYTKYNYIEFDTSLFIKNPTDQKRPFGIRIKTTMEKISQDKSEYMQKKYFYNASYASWAYSGDFSLAKTEETIASVNGNIPVRVNRYSNEYTNVYFKQNGYRKIISKSSTFAPLGLRSDVIYNTDYFSGGYSALGNADYYYNTGLPVLQIDSAGSSVKSRMSYEYYSGGLRGKVNRIIKHDISNPSRSSVIEYTYILTPLAGSDGNQAVPQKVTYCSKGLSKEYEYYGSGDWYFDAGCKLVYANTNNEVNTRTSRQLTAPSFSVPKHIITKLDNVFHSDIYQLRQTLPGGQYFLVDENKQYHEYDFDGKSRVIAGMIPGSIKNLPTDEFSPISSFADSIKYMYYDNKDSLYMFVPARYKTASVPSTVAKESYCLFNGAGQITKYAVKADNGQYETKFVKTYDYLGNLISETNADGITRDYFYDYLGRLVKTGYTDGSRETVGYYYYNGVIGGLGYSEQRAFTDAEDKITVRYYDIEGKIIAVKKTGQEPVLYYYNSIGQLTSVRTPEGKVTIYSYDGFGNICEKTTPDEGTVKYKYDRSGRLRFMLNSAEMVYVKYDPLDRILCKGTLPKAKFVSLNADNAYETLPDNFENMTAGTDSMLVVNMYDTLKVAGVFSGMNFTGGTLKNTKGRLVATAFRDKKGDSWSYKVYSYDHLGRVRFNWIKLSGTNTWKSIINTYDQLAQTGQNVDNEAFFYQYDKQYRLSKVLGTGNTLYRSYSYNASDQILTDNLWQTNTATIGQIQYSYDPSRGWINMINEQQGGRFKEVLGYTKPYYNDSKRNGNIYSQNIYQKNQQGITETKVFNYSYDQYDRLLSSVCSGYPSYSESYQYDMDGNIKLKSGGTKNYQYTYNSGKNTLSGIIDDGQSLLRYSFMYDGKGNMTQKYESTLGARLNINQYDYRNLPLSMTTSNTRTGVQPVTTTYSYDEQGQRVKKKTGSVLNEYVVRDHAGRELAIYDASSNLLKQVNIYGRSLEGRYDVRWDYVQVPVEEDVDPSGYITVLQKTVTGTYYYIKDHLGSIRQTVKRDGVFSSLRNYYPYGSVMNESISGSTTEKYQYTGKERDKESGLDYFGARYYDSDLGVWLNIDPMADKYHGWSPYNYCLNNPMNFVDPDGRDIRYSIDDKNKTLHITIRANFIGNIDEKTLNSWSNEITKQFSMKIDEGKFKGYSADTRLEATINAKADKNYYQIIYENTSNPNARSRAVLGAGRTYPDGSKAKLFSNATRKTVAHEFGHIMGNDDTYIFNDYDNDGLADPGEVSDSDPGSIMGNYKSNKAIKPRGYHISNAIEVSDRERKYEEENGE